MHRLMPSRTWILLVVMFASPACTRRYDSSDAKPLPEDRGAAVERDVRAFLQTVAHDVTAEGPTAWTRHFANDPAFFMANDGRLVFLNFQAAAQGVQAFARMVPHVELRWGDDTRVDVLAPNLAMVATSWSETQTDTAGHQVNESGFFTGLAEKRAGRWQFRDTHWSSVPPVKAP